MTKKIAIKINHILILALFPILTFFSQIDTVYYKKANELYREGEIKEASVL